MFYVYLFPHKKRYWTEQFFTQTHNLQESEREKDRARERERERERWTVIEESDKNNQPQTKKYDNCQPQKEAILNRVGGGGVGASVPSGGRTHTLWPEFTCAYLHFLLSTCLDTSAFFQCLRRAKISGGTERLQLLVAGGGPRYEMARSEVSIFIAQARRMLCCCAKWHNLASIPVRVALWPDSLRWNGKICGLHNSL